jgi:ATP-binding cassette, subfamily B, bacterial CvaB/MchF/RaxB
MAMPMQYESLVGDMGSTLSGGQKQRVLVAKALYVEPQILFIDEGTAHLDEFIEDKLLNNLADLGITRITIAHRSKAISKASRVILVTNGVAQICASTTQNEKGDL